MKRAIDWLFAALGAATALVGVWWMWTGWDIVQVERGWAAVIAGSAMLSGGLVTLTVAWATIRLRQALAGGPPGRGEEDLARNAPGSAAILGGGALAGAAAAAAIPGMQDHADKPPTAPDEPELPAEGGGDQKQASTDHRISIGDLLNRRDPFAPDSEPDRAPPVEPLEFPAEIVHGVDEAEAAASFARAWPAPVDEPHQPVVSVGHSTTEAEPPEHPELHDEQEQEPAAEPEPVDSDEDWLDHTARALDRELGRSSMAAPEPHHEPEIEPPPAREPAVTGRYSSGDTNYIMFDDGSIEAQTPDGVMRFDSLIELRRFVEQRT